MSGAQPEERVPVPLLVQRWCDVAFLHWRFDPERIAALLPSGVSVDTYDGAAWVTLTPFAVEGSRPAVMPPVPGLSNFLESNLRTYVVGPDGRDGLWFLTLETNSWWTTAAARGLLGVPYRLARMGRRRVGDRVTYSSRRRLEEPAPRHRTTIATTPDGAVAEPQLAAWLTGRWRAWTRPAGRLVAVPVEHERWPISDATLVDHDDTLFRSVGLPDPSGEPVVHAAPGVTARLGWPSTPNATRPAAR